jgi:hypothetical protein
LGLEEREAGQKQQLTAQQHQYGHQTIDFDNLVQLVK